MGRYHFTTAEALVALGGPLAKVRAELRQLKAAGEVVEPHRSLHVIVPADQRDCGCLPPRALVPPLMQYLHESYYAALLSACEIYGVRPPQAHPFQVMAKVTRKPIECGEVHLQSLGRKDLEQTPLLAESSPRPALRVASPEATALELVGYAHQCGGLVNIAAVLDELVRSLDPEKLAAVAPSAPIAWTQRLRPLREVQQRQAERLKRRSTDVLYTGA